MPRKPNGPRAMTATERSRNRRVREAEELHRLRDFVAWIIECADSPVIVAEARKIIGLVEIRVDNVSTKGLRYLP